jgi:hypothetical protein
MAVQRQEKLLPCIEHSCYDVKTCFSRLNSMKAKAVGFAFFLVATGTALLLRIRNYRA